MTPTQVSWWIVLSQFLTLTNAPKQQTHTNIILLSNAFLKTPWLIIQVRFKMARALKNYLQFLNFKNYGI